ncbi:TPA: small membrane protein [Klebsiella quasipneumoniae subsp. similipneumoniae]|nr:small membrane protein [Klebsiella quasipneumoniae subsp. similipneumoniae]HCI4647923.1 small membrane protein [Klebsiella quasipneumoniae subsp. similipneumoniae]HCI6410308.1 small membrane protein [Klebsiella quasipneumoniae subsp. similipneumoniae]HCI6655266.1 small membrane protein [Klebsiella quasipneumoniae subsp. similipneumoniae]HCI6804849.1 small membrane protein [Klebsiella quasipneumoniae subsp. similipneumoniae]
MTNLFLFGIAVILLILAIGSYISYSKDRKKHKRTFSKRR